jgi:acetylornithine deacetylase/succinyl-diaminopimelate desuccinylase-like protein
LFKSAKLPQAAFALLLAAGMFAILTTPSFTTGAQTEKPTASQQLAREILKELIEINTTHQFGSTKAAEALAVRLKAAGFPASDVQVLAPDKHPTKGNLVARLRGRGKAKPVLFVAHLDVVDARKEDWSDGIDPFQFTERDGFFYGRGTLDVKGEAASLVANLIRLRQEGFVPEQAIVVALTADEEAGGEANGVEWLIRNHRDLIDAAYVINTDAGGGQIEKTKHVRYTLQTGEKVFLTFRLEVRNSGGHSSLPVKDNAIYRLAHGLTRLASYDFPAKLNETTRAYFERMSVYEKGQVSTDMKAVAKAQPDSAALVRLSNVSPLYNSTMRTTCVATMLEAGHAENALPQTARATVNCRLLPGEAPEEVKRTLASVLADEQITVTPLNEAVTSPASQLIPEVTQPIERLVAQMWPGVPVVPVMDPWTSDSTPLRRAGFPVYGAAAIFYEIDPIRAHGKDERIGVREFYEGLEFAYRLMKELTQTQSKVQGPRSKV